MSGRLGRYPSGAKGTPTWHGWIADTNFPTEMTPWHTYMENPPWASQIFKQPSGCRPKPRTSTGWCRPNTPSSCRSTTPSDLAQGRKYYERFVEMYGEDSDWVRRYVKAEYGDDPSAPRCSRIRSKSDFHIVDDTLLIPGYPILVGQDFGRNPWS
jgi:hypothetical protein